MSGSTRRRLRSEISRDNYLDDADEGTAARTRPLSYDEIMLKRESKKKIEDFKDKADPESSRNEETVRNSDHHGRDTNRSAMKNSRDYAHEASSRKKEEKTSKVEDTQGKRKNKGSLDVESRSKDKHEKGSKNSTETLKNDSRGHGRNKPDEHSRDDPKYGYEKSKNSTETVKNDSRGHGRNKPEEHSRDDPKYGYEKRHHKDSLANERHIERNRAPDRESKRKDRGGDDDKHRTRDTVKKHDSGRKHSEISERKEKIEPSSSRHEEMRSKRRRSRTPERVLDKGRSRSSSPKTRKNVSSHGHDDLSSHSQRDRAKHHSEVDQKKMSSNGSGGHHRRHGGSSSGLGGYSPRKRKTEAAVKTPSPVRSPERKSAGWDPPSSGGDRNLSSSVASGPQLLPQTVPSNMIGLAGGISVASSMGRSLPAILSNNMSAFKETSLDSIQLTQATRPMRRLYIDNVPASTSEKDIMDCFNNFLLSSGANHNRGTRPCISCMIHKEKGQALLEFLTPEYASAALLFDGRSLFGSIVKVRRPKDFFEAAVRIKHPKDFVEAASGYSEKSKARADAISNIVKDSPHKIFIGGIAEGLSSEMIMEIVSAFGPLKAYCFKINEELNEPCAFLEYADQSVTLKACAGLNGMKLGGRVLTVAQAVPHITSVENSERMPFYGIPEHVKPLLETPTEVLKLNNVLDRKAIELLSEMDLEEIVEDVRLECSRFGTVVSINVVKADDVCTAIPETKEVAKDAKGLQSMEERDPQDCNLNVESMEGSLDPNDGGSSAVEPSSKIEEHEGDGAKEGDEHDSTVVELGATGTSSVEDTKENDEIAPQNREDGAGNHPQELTTMDCSTIEDTKATEGFDREREEEHIKESEMCPSEKTDIDKLGDGETPSVDDTEEFDKTNHKLEEGIAIANDSATSKTGATENGVKNESGCETDNIFEVGCVLVEFKRAEASWMAAHCLHGRVFDDRVVTVEYVPLDAYQARFSKGVQKPEVPHSYL